MVLTDRVHPANQAAATISGTGRGAPPATSPSTTRIRRPRRVTAIVSVSASGYSAALDLSSLSIGTLVATVTLTDAAGNTGASGNDTATKVGPPLDRGPAQGRP